MSCEAIKWNSCQKTEHLANHKKLEKKISILTSTSPLSNMKRVYEYVSDENAQKVIKEILPVQACKGTISTLALTAGGAAVGGGIGGIVGNIPGAIIGGGIGGGIGFLSGIYVSKELIKRPLRNHYEKWKKETRDKECVTEIQYLIKNDYRFDDIRCPVTLEDYEIPILITICGHTIDAKEIEKILQKKEESKNPASCPCCRTDFSKEDLTLDIIMIAKMKKIYGDIASLMGDNVQDMVNLYGPEVLKAFKAMAQDSEEQLMNIFLESSAQLLLMMKEKKINFEVYKRKHSELEEKFQDIFIPKDHR